MPHKFAREKEREGGGRLVRVIKSHAKSDNDTTSHVFLRPCESVIDK